MFRGGAPVVVPFLTAGFPNREVFLSAAQAALDAGAGALEIGMPFSDPLADGAAIQHSSQTALNNGVTMDDVFELAAQLRSKTTRPIFLMGYLNPMLKRGMDRFARNAAAAGVDGTIIPDCPIEEANEWTRASKAAGLDNIFLIAPTSPDDRIRRIDRLSTRFSYCVSIAGVTGARRDVSKETIAYLQRVRRVARKPFVVGFGISNPAHIKSLSGLADGYVVGSALVPLLESGSRTAAAKRVADLVGSLVRAASRSGE
jgi:tryptophan synthase alpha chain